MAVLLADDSELFSDETLAVAVEIGEREDHQRCCECTNADAVEFLAARVTPPSFADSLEQ